VKTMDRPDADMSQSWIGRSVQTAHIRRLFETFERRLVGSIDGRGSRRIEPRRDCRRLLLLRATVFLRR
jgi:hypothetical protein